MAKHETLFNETLKQVESNSIREWASSEHNRPLWLEIAKGYVGKPNASELLLVDIVGTAIGL
jgi:hypothetical protein